MLTKNRRGNRIWVGFIVITMFLLIVSEEPIALLLSAAAVAFAFAYIIGKSVQLPARHRRQRYDVTDAAHAARLHSTYRPDFDEYYGLQDIGLIIDEQDHTGLRMRRTRTISMNDRAVRPYIVINAPRDARHPEQVLVRFEMTDANGQRQFVYEMNYYMRPGENAILPDYRLPLAGNDRLGRAGQWELAAWINGGLLGIHSFNVQPSHAERSAKFTTEQRMQQRGIEDKPPVSLEELLAKQRHDVGV